MEKKDIEDLSNIVFGLALTVGTLTLVKPSEDSFGELLKVLGNFALSFLVLLWFWWLYNQTMKDTVMDRRVKYALNFVLLFLVIIEPYLLTIINTVSGATAYAIDLGTTMVIFFVFWHFLLQESPAEDEEKQRRLRRGLRSMAVSAAVFYASTLLQLFPSVASSGIQGVIWLVLLVVVMAYRLR